MRKIKYPTQLTQNELSWTYAIGEKRHNEAKNLPDKHGLNKEKGLEVHQVGASGEYAFSVISGIPWEAHINTFKRKPDVGDFEVRTRTQDWHDLIIREDDEDERPYVLVFACIPWFVIKGYITGKEAKSHPEWLKKYGNREEAWFVPQNFMQDFIWE